MHVVQEAALVQLAVIAAPANGALLVAPALCAQKKQIKQKANPIPLQAPQNLPVRFLPNAKPKPKKEQDAAAVQEAMATAGSMEDRDLFS